MNIYNEMCYALNLLSLNGRKWATHSSRRRNVWKASLCGRSISKPYRVCTIGPFCSGSKSSIRKSIKKYEFMARPHNDNLK